MTIEKIRPTFTFTEDRLEELRAVLPEAFADGRLNWEALREALGTYVDEEGEEVEHFGLFWPGKRQARRLAALPSKGTLLPVPGQGVNEDTTRNVFIEGDNLEVLKLLQKSYAGQIKMIYIDPPYNTGNDFVYRDDFSEPLEDYLRRTHQVDGKGMALSSVSNEGGRFHSSWLDMMYPRLVLARQLLRDDGLIFVSIDDNEFHHLRMLMNEVFGEENRIESFVWKKSYGGGAKEKYAVTQHEYILLYARQLQDADELWLPPDPEAERRYYKFRDAKFETRGPYRIKPLEASKSMDKRENLIYPIPTPWGGYVKPKRQWWWSSERVTQALEDDELVFIKTGESTSVSYKQYLRDKDGNVRGAKPFSVLDGMYTQQGTADLTALLGDPPVLQFPKPVTLMKKLLSMATAPQNNDLILDFFAGSCTTAQAVLELNREDGGNRRFMMIQWPEPVLPDSKAAAAGYSNIADIGKARVGRVISKMQRESAGKLPIGDCTEDLGFKVFALGRTNYKPWRNSRASDINEIQTLFDSVESPLVDDWARANLLAELMLQQGFPLDSRVTIEEQYLHNEVVLVEAACCSHRLVVCLDDELHAATIEHLSHAGQNIVICHDSALSDQAKVRLADICNLKVI